MASRSRKSRRRPPQPPRPVAVIDIGSSAVRMIIAEVTGTSQWRPLETAEKPVALGRDAFVKARISRQTINQCLDILHGFLVLMEPYGITEVKAVATSALRVAVNRETFIDRVQLNTGINVDIIEGVESNFLTYLAVRHALRSYRPSLGQVNSIIMEVGGGSTEVVLLQRGRMVAAHTLDIGTIRTDQTIRSVLGSSRQGVRMARFVRDNMRSDLEDLASEMRLNRIKRFVAVGGDARLAAKYVGHPAAPTYSLVARSAFLDFTNRLEQMTVAETVDAFGVSYSDAEALLPALLVYREFLMATSATELIVPKTSIRDGILLEMSRNSEDASRIELYSQVVAAAESLGRKFHYDAVHARFVADTALELFDLLHDEHGLSRHERLLLEVASILHDIGHYISFHRHHRHGQYIISNSDIFGLHGQDVQIVANVVRYHRKSTPDFSHPAYSVLPVEARITVSKLAAILRIAEALDYSHTQRILGTNFRRDGDTLIVRCRRTVDMSLEQLSLGDKVGLFEEVFGLRVVLAALPHPALNRTPNTE